MVVQKITANSRTHTVLVSFDMIYSTLITQHNFNISSIPLDVCRCENNFSDRNKFIEQDTYLSEALQVSVDEEMEKFLAVYEKY